MGHHPPIPRAFASRTAERACEGGVMDGGERFGWILGGRDKDNLQKSVQEFTTNSIYPLGIGKRKIV